MAKRGIEALAAVPLFDGLPRRDIRRIRDLGNDADYMAGATIVKQGDDADSFFVILTGEAKVTIGGRVVNRLVPGDHFGEISLLDGGRRTASVVSETPVSLLEFTRAPFMRLLEQEPRITMSMLTGMARMWRRTQRSLEA
jgi:CRP/FNR family transcriptional regulator, cyclic AMP receptor protein